MSEAVIISFAYKGVVNLKSGKFIIDTLSLVLSNLFNILNPINLFYLAKE